MCGEWLEGKWEGLYMSERMDGIGVCDGMGWDMYK